MAIDFKDSRTKDNLMRAFAGESQARNRYTFAAETAGEQGMFSIGRIFLFTADQERAHAKRFYELLHDLSGTVIPVDGSYPVDDYSSLAELLRAAQHNEMEEFDHIYPAFGDIAKEEGFIEAAAAFYQIAKIEEIHGRRFAKLAELLSKNRYFESETEQAWMCMNCGHIHFGKRVPRVCPVCKHKRGYFIPAALAPYLEESFIAETE